MHNLLFLFYKLIIDENLIKIKLTLIWSYLQTLANFWQFIRYVSRREPQLLSSSDLDAAATRTLVALIPGRLRVGRWRVLLLLTRLAARASLGP